MGGRPVRCVRGVEKGLQSIPLVAADTALEGNNLPVVDGVESVVIVVLQPGEFACHSVSPFRVWPLPVALACE